jgi:hypothetical protein
VWFLDALDAEYEFAWTIDTLKHRFIDFTNVVSYDAQKAVIELSGHFGYLK